MVSWTHHKTSQWMHIAVQSNRTRHSTTLTLRALWRLSFNYLIPKFVMVYVTFHWCIALMWSGFVKLTYDVTWPSHNPWWNNPLQKNIIVIKKYRQDSCKSKNMDFIHFSGQLNTLKEYDRCGKRGNEATIVLFFRNSFKGLGVRVMTWFLWVV